MQRAGPRDKVSSTHFHSFPFYFKFFTFPFCHFASFPVHFPFLISFLCPLSEPISLPCNYYTLLDHLPKQRSITLPHNSFHMYSWYSIALVPQWHPAMQPSVKTSSSKEGPNIMHAPHIFLHQSMSS